jgi:hypothetical protein
MCAVLRLALPKHRLEQLQPVALGSSAALRMGERVWVLGSIANGAPCGPGPHLSHAQQLGGACPLLVDCCSMALHEVLVL